MKNADLEIWHQIGTMNAIQAIRPLSEISGSLGTYSKINWHGAEPIPEADLIAKQKELIADYDAKEYQRLREPENPSIEECVHAILDGELDALQVKRKLVKEKFPKPA